MSQSPELVTLLRAGSVLLHTDSQPTASDLKAVLSSRLAQYRALRGLPEHGYSSASQEDLQRATALEALFVVERVQQILDSEVVPLQNPSSGPASSASPRKYNENTPGETPLIGTRDISQLRTLLSIVFKWGIDPLLAHVQSAWPSKTSQPQRGASHSDPRIIDLTGIPEDYTLLTSMLRRAMSLLFPQGVNGKIPQTLITAAVLNRHVTDLLNSGIDLGWIPKSLATADTPVVDDMRTFVMKLLSMLPPSQTITSLGSILSNRSSQLAPHIKKTCSSLLSRQLLRPEGVRGLCAAVFGEGEGVDEDASLEKLDHVAQVLGTPPAAVKPEEYFDTIVTRTLYLISSEDNVPAVYRRAASFSLSRMLSASSPHQILVRGILFPILHAPFLESSAPKATTSSSSTIHTPPLLSASAALRTIQTFVTNTDPSPTLISTLLSPVLSSLYALFESLERHKTADPALRESVRGLLATWGRIVESEEGVAVLWACVENPGSDWAIDIAGEMSLMERTEKEPSLSIFTPEDLKRAEETGEMDVGANILDLRPDPTIFVRYLKSLDRVDVSSEIFVRLLEAYRETKSDTDSDPMRTLLYLQIIMQMQMDMTGEGQSLGSTSSIFSKPDHILSFVLHALESSVAPTPQPAESQKTEKQRGLAMSDLRIVEVEEEDDRVDEADSDDEVPGAEGVPPEEEMTATAINLLLSILEANTDISTHNTPILLDILAHIERLSTHQSDTLRPLAREARMVLTVREASTSDTSSRRRASDNDPSSTVQHTYQKALKLLQDPILPVRAHGLLLLRQLVLQASSDNATSSSDSTKATVSAVRPLVPAILDIFLQSAQDDDSYVFLNAVQGLSALVDGYGLEVLRSLIRVYTSGLEGSGAGVLSQTELDTKIRVGEALGQVIRRYGDALPLYADVIVPSLFAVVRAAHLPTTLRTSSLSLLSQCAETNDAALIPYAIDLSDATLDLLQLESVQAKPVAPSATRPTPQPADPYEAPVPSSEAKQRPQPAERVSPEPTMDSHPTARNSKFPPLRRAALHFLAQLVRSYTAKAYDDNSTFQDSGQSFPIRRAKTTLGYVAATDVDLIVRVMAREVSEAVQALEKALIGV